nr:RNA-directed DNA polymerase, eukaryota [Tanacetum cinerariifolium]
MKSFFVASVRSLTDNHMLLEVSSKTRQISNVSIKVDSHAWKVRLEYRPTLFNLSGRGVDIHSIVCSNYGMFAESTSYVFFACPMAREIYCKITTWWDLNVLEFTWYEEWLVWLMNLKLPYNLKLVLEGVFYTMWWIVWNFQNKSIFGSSIPSKAMLFDDIYWLVLSIVVDIDKFGGAFEQDIDDEGEEEKEDEEGLFRLTLTLSGIHLEVDFGGLESQFGKSVMFDFHEPLRDGWIDFLQEPLILGISLKRPLSKGTVNHQRQPSSWKISATSSRLEMRHYTKPGNDIMIFYINDLLMTSIATRRNIESSSNSEGIAAIVKKLENLRAHLDKDCPLKEEEKSVEEVKYGEFGRPFPNNNRNDGRFNRGGYDQPSSGERRPSLTEIIKKYIEEASKRHVEQDEYGKVCKMTRERILKDHWRERFGDEEDDLEENLEDLEECEEDKTNAIMGAIHDKLNDGEIYIKVKVLGVYEIPRTRDNVAAMRARLKKKMAHEGMAKQRHNFHLESNLKTRPPSGFERLVAYAKCNRDSYEREIRLFYRRFARIIFLQSSLKEESNAHGSLLF